MALIVQSNNKNAATDCAATKKLGHTRPASVADIELSKPGRLRVGHLMTYFSVSHSTLYEHMKSGRVPKPDGRDGKRPFWNTATIRPYLDAAQACTK